MNQLRYSHLITLFLLGFINVVQVNAQSVYTYSYTGAIQTYTVPDGITTVQVEAWGGQGQPLTFEDYDGSTGGLGGYVSGFLAVTPGEVLYIQVGGMGTEGAGGYNGGAVGGYGIPSDGDEGHAGSGGGASDVRQGGTGWDDRVIVAGGGGGGGRDYVNGECQPCGTGGNGGAGGGLTGEDGNDPGWDVGFYPNVGSGGKGGEAAAGGAGGSGTEGENGNSGSLGMGGIGIDGNYSVASGGGGGGYYGGGSGAGALLGSGVAGGGGAGGSSYTGGLTDTETLPGIWAGNGKVVITEICFGLEVTASATTICLGDSIVLTATSHIGSEVTWSDPDLSNGEAFFPSTTGMITYHTISDSTGDCPFEITILVNELPSVEIMATDSILCMGEELILLASGADSYSWEYGVINGVPFTPEPIPGEQIYAVVGINDSTGCADTTSITILIGEIPDITAIADQPAYCEGELITLTAIGADSVFWDDEILNDEPFLAGVGEHWFTATGVSEFGCVDTTVLIVNVYPNPVITLTGIDELFGDDGHIFLTVDLGLAPFNFDWDVDGTGDMDDPQNLTDIPGGTYAVTMTDANGCSAAASIVLNSQLGLSASAKETVQIYPNPAIDHVTVTLPAGISASTIYIYNSAGVLVIEQVVNGATEIIDLHELPAGFYWVKISSDDGLLQSKLVKK